MNPRPSHNLEEANRNPQELISQGLEDLLDNLDQQVTRHREGSPPISQVIQDFVEI